MSAASPPPIADSQATESAAGAHAAGSSAQSGGTSVGSAADVVQDIGQGEAYTAQLKRQVANELTLDAQLQQSAVRMIESTANLREKLDAAHADQVRSLNGNLAAHVKNIDTVTHAEQNRTVRHGDVAADRTWNIDEQTHAVSQMIRRGEVTLTHAELATTITSAVLAALRQTSPADVSK